MPLRDHFEPPLDDWTSWDGLHGMWPAMIVQDLVDRLPLRYTAAPNVHLGSIEVDVATFERESGSSSSIPSTHVNGGPGSSVIYAPPRPTLAVAGVEAVEDTYEVRIYDMKRGRRLVAAVEIVSPSNKDRPESRRGFVAKCVAMLRERVCVAIVDLVTGRSANLYLELLEHFGRSDPSWTEVDDGPPSIYATSCRWIRRTSDEGGPTALLEAWAHRLALGVALPTLPLWLADDLAVPLDLERSYEQACRLLRIG